ncbi:MAG: type II toxin-antitoxin system RelB/DinJ family antitoxin [Desemzia incerta]|uniref:type II toxin-antitoxin system RelB/DinJ family antitoxin n=1 Tax=Desemzia incerta TaxID=82801 RepID=UPI0033149E25
MTTKTKSLQVRIDGDLKDEADELFNQLGTTTNEAIKIFLKTAVRNKGIPFPISLEAPNAETQKAIQEAIQEAYDIIDEKIQTTTYVSVEDLMKDLKS